MDISKKATPRTGSGYIAVPKLTLLLGPYLSSLQMLAKLENIFMYGGEFLQLENILGIALLQDPPLKSRDRILLHVENIADLRTSHPH